MNRYYTLLFLPEKSDKIRKLVIPSWVLRTSLVAILLFGLVIAVMVVDYVYVMNQITETKELRVENRKLRQQVQIFTNRMKSVEDSMDRVQTMAAKIKVITNIEERSSLFQAMKESPPDATEISKASYTHETPSEGLNPVLAEIDSELAHSGDPEKLAMTRDIHSLSSRIMDISDRGVQTEILLVELYELLNDQRGFLSALPTIRPTFGDITSGFGVRRDPFGGRFKMHEGIDIANHTGTVIRASADGSVLHAQGRPGYGQTVILDHGYGLETWYAHNKKVLVKSGQRVKRGDPIAHLGDSGRSTGPHLHYEVRVNGIPVDPIPYILEN